MNGTKIKDPTAMQFPTENTREHLLKLIDDMAPFSQVARAYALHVTATLGNKVKAADLLGVDRRTLQRWAKAASWPVGTPGAPAGRKSGSLFPAASEAAPEAE